MPITDGLLAPEPLPDSDDAAVLAQERRLLGFLIGGECAPEAARELMHRLRSYRFRGVEHRVLFECAMAAASRAGWSAGEELRPRLLEALVRAGFPDLDLDRFPASPALSEPEAETLCETLLRRGTP